MSEIKDEDYIKHLFNEFDKHSKTRSRIASCLCMSTTDEEVDKKHGLQMRYFKLKQIQKICLAELEVIADEVWANDKISNHLPL